MPMNLCLKKKKKRVELLTVKFWISRPVKEFDRPRISNQKRVTPDAAI